MAALKRKQPKRDWSEARAKLEREAYCRVCGFGGHKEYYDEPLEAAHTISRQKQDESTVGPRGGEVLRVRARSIVPLCKSHHEQFDRRELDLLPFLNLGEQLDAVHAAGGIVAALKRISGRSGVA